MRKASLTGLCLLVAGCAAIDSPAKIDGELLRVPSPDGSAVAILAREGDHYSLYLKGLSRREPLEKMLEVRKNRPATLRWRDNKVVWMDGICGSIIYTHSNDYLYPHAGGGIGIGFTGNCARI